MTTYSELKKHQAANQRQGQEDVTACNSFDFYFSYLIVFWYVSYFNH